MYKPIILTELAADKMLNVHLQFYILKSNTDF